MAYVLNNDSLWFPQILFVYRTRGRSSALKLLHSCVAIVSMQTREQAAIFCESAFTNGKDHVSTIIAKQEYSKTVHAEINCQDHKVQLFQN